MRALIICSKSELKKRIKQREQEEKKRQKAASSVPQAEKKAASAEEQESELTPNVKFSLASHLAGRTNTDIQPAIL